MKVAIINLSGNIGKSTIGTSLLSPRIPNIGAENFFSVESTNTGAESEGIDLITLKGKQFGDMQDQLLRYDSAVVDVGSSNVSDWLKLLQQYSGSHEEFDYFVVPVLNDFKVITDSIKTIRALKAVGVDKKRVRVVFNRVEVDDDIQDIFAPIFGLSESEKNCVVNPKSVIYNNQIFEMLKENGISITEVLNDETDYRALLRTAQTEEDKDLAITRIKLKQLSRSAKQNLDDVFTVLFK